LTRQFNLAPKAVTARDWILNAKKHPAWKKEWKRLKRRKGEHDGKHSFPVVLALDYEEYQGDGTYRPAVECAVFLLDKVFSVTAYGLRAAALRENLLPAGAAISDITADFLRVRVEIAGAVFRWIERLDRVSSVELMRSWTFEVLLDFDKHMDHVRGGPLSEVYAERYSDVTKYLCHFLKYAKTRWEEEGIEAIQVRLRGLLPTNSAGPNSKVRQCFPGREVTRNATGMIEQWLRETVAPVLKVDRE
jgi:hypothetical protein